MKKQGLMAGFALVAAMAVGAAGFAAESAPRIGDRVPDGTIYAGISADANKPQYTTPADAPGPFTWNKSNEYCSALEAGGHHDWRVPTKGELNVLFTNRAAIGGFNEAGSYPADLYWSNAPLVGNTGWAQRFSNGQQRILIKGSASSLRCVR